MTLLRKRIRNERGQAIVLVVISLVVMLGMAAAVLDVGSWYRADRKLQTTMDAAALAAAQALPSDTGAAGGLAGEYADKNGGALDSVTFSTTAVANDTVTVTGSQPTPGFFSRIFGIDSVTVNATATARVGALSTARGVAPIGVDALHPELQCDPSPCSNNPTVLDLDKVGPGAFRLINVDGSHGGTPPHTLADWIVNGSQIDMERDQYYGDPGAKFNSSHFKDALDAVIGRELLFPVYDDIQGSGANAEYHIVGWVGFVITGYNIHGSQTNQIEGYFTEVIWDGDMGTTPPPDDFGARTISLIK
jgi:Flp pilus assembly protein TadG